MFAGNTGHNVGFSCSGPNIFYSTQNCLSTIILAHCSLETPKRAFGKQCRLRLDAIAIVYSNQIVWKGFKPCHCYYFHPAEKQK